MGILWGAFAVTAISYSGLLIVAQNLQAQAVHDPGFYSWHDLDLAGRIFPYDPVLRETAAASALEMGLPKCMTLPVFERTAKANPYDPRLYNIIHKLRDQPGPTKC